MRIPFLFAGALIAALAAPGAAPAHASGDAVQYVRELLAGMLAVSKRPTKERRAFYERFLSEEIDWHGPAKLALGPRFAALSAEDRAKLAEWSRKSVLGHDGVMQFVQNLVFQSCGISSKDVGAEVSSIRINCTRFGADPNFTVRFEVARQGPGYRIADVGYIGISLREELGKEIFKKDAVAEHGVQAGAIAAKN
jgi:ABC-type transporter MlaC component